MHGPGEGYDRSLLIDMNWAITGGDGSAPDLKLAQDAPPPTGDSPRVIETPAPGGWGVCIVVVTALLVAAALLVVVWLTRGTP